MKKLVLIIGCFLIASKLFAQDCTHYLYMQKNKTIEMTGYNKKGDVTMKSVSTVSDVKTSNGVTTANVVAQVYDKNGKLVGTSSSDYSCNGGVISMKMHINTDQKTKQTSDINVKVSGGNAEEYPLDMKVGDHLNDYTSQVLIGNGATATVKVTDRVVLAKESVTTTAGTWECFKISYKSSTSTAFNNNGSQDSTTNKVTSILGKLKLKMPTVNNEATIWFAPDFGLIRSETKNSKMELTALK